MSESAPTASDPNFMLSLARGLSVLEAFSAVYPEVTIAALTRKTGLPRSVVTRCIHTLSELGYIASEGRSFGPRPRLLRLADVYLTEGALPGIVQPFLDGLRDEIGESCSVGVLDGDDLVYLARATQPRLINISLHAGSRLPAWCTSMGRVLLAAWPEESVESYLKRVAFVPRTEKTIVDRRKLLKIIQKVSQEGYALVDQEVEKGLRSIAVPVRDQKGVVIAALNVGTTTGQLNLTELKKRILPRLLGAAQQIQDLYRKEMGHRTSSIR